MSFEMPADADIRRKNFNLLEDYMAALEASENDPENVELEKAAEAAHLAYMNSEGPDFEFDEETDEPLICSATGLPVWEGEDHLYRPYTGQVFLSSVFGLEPLDVEEELEPETVQ